MIKCIMDTFYVTTLNSSNVHGVGHVNNTLGFSIRTSQNVCIFRHIYLCWCVFIEGF